MGFRTPVIFSWPGHVPARRVVDDLISFEDVHATLLDYADVPLPPDHAGFILKERIEGSGGPVRDRVARPGSARTAARARSV